MTSLRKDWEELNLSREEVNNLTEALKNEEFRKLLIQYVEETQAPDNRKKYQDDIVQLEAERGIDCKFVNPTPGFVIKTSIDGVGKAFINVASNTVIGKPNIGKRSDIQGSRQCPIYMPYSLTPGRDDYDKKNQRCIVYDAVFHPDTLQLALTNPQIKNYVVETALNGVETEFKVKLDKRNIKLPKLKYKGAFYAAVIRKPSENPPDITEEDVNLREELKFPDIPPPRQPTKEVKKPEPVAAYTTPHYVIKYRNDVDLQEFTFDKNAKLHAAIPKELVIEIYLPLLRSSKNIKLDIASKSLDLICEKTAKYKLNLCLPYTVSEEGSAKFDVDKKRLIVTLPVIRQNNECLTEVEGTLHEYVREDSGVESDLGDHLIHELTEEKSDEDVESKEETTEAFLISNLYYSLPPFDYNRDTNSLCFILNVKNVDPTSIKHMNILEDHGFHIKFTSIGSGFFPIHYAFCAKFASKFLDSITVDAWDNNVTVLVHLTALQDEDSIWIGTCLEDMQEKKVDGIMELKKAVEALSVEEVEKRENVVRIESVDADEVVFEVEFKGQQEDSEGEEEENVAPTPKTRTYSEGSSDESPGGVRRGILKNRLNRSLSESCADTVGMDGVVLYTWSDSCLPEQREGKEVKKTVRFSQKIQQQVFRANSSILGQRKKNQKRTRNRRKALERRASESENSEGEEREKWMKHKTDRQDLTVEKQPVSVLKTVIPEETKEEGAKEGKRKKANKRSTTRPVQFSSTAVTQLND